MTKSRIPDPYGGPNDKRMATIDGEDGPTDHLHPEESQQTGEYSASGTTNELNKDISHRLYTVEQKVKQIEKAIFRIKEGFSSKTPQRDLDELNSRLNKLDNSVTMLLKLRKTSASINLERHRSEVCTRLANLEKHRSETCTRLLSLEQTIETLQSTKSKQEKPSQQRVGSLGAAFLDASKDTSDLKEQITTLSSQLINIKHQIDKHISHQEENDTALVNEVASIIDENNAKCFSKEEATALQQKVEQLQTALNAKPTDVYTKEDGDALYTMLEEQNEVIEKQGEQIKQLSEQLRKQATAYTALRERMFNTLNALFPPIK